MKIKVLAVGKTDDKNLQMLIDKYQKRLRHYVKFEFEVVPDLKKTKNLSFAEQKTAEGQAILKKLNSADYVLLFDEKGEEYGSVGFARFLQKKNECRNKGDVLDNRRSLWIFRGNIYQSQWKNFTIKDDLFTSDDTLVCHRTDL